MENPDYEGKLIVIVGEKISIEEVENPNIDLFLPYSKFIAHYKILEKVCGNYDKQEISFTVFDHYGFPAFANYDHALLFLNKEDTAIYHEIYQYFPLYKTKNGRWASDYNYTEYPEETKIKPEKIEFAEEVSHSIEGLTRATTQRRFPEPYFKIDKENKKAIAVWGNYVPELFQLKKDGVLRYRGYFGKVETSNPVVKELALEYLEDLELSKQDSVQLIKIWTSLLSAIEKNDTLGIKKVSLDSITCSACEGMPKFSYENNLESIDMFIDSVRLNLKKAGLSPLQLKEKFRIDVIKYPGTTPTTFSLDDNEKLVIYSIYTYKDLKEGSYTYQQRHSFKFVKIKGRFLLYAMESN